MLAVGVQAAGVAAVANRNTGMCASPYLNRQPYRRLMAAAYRVLQPAVAPLEPCSAWRAWAPASPVAAAYVVH